MPASSFSVSGVPVTVASPCHSNSFGAVTGQTVVAGTDIEVPLRRESALCRRLAAAAWRCGLLGSGLRRAHSAACTHRVHPQAHHRVALAVSHGHTLRRRTDTAPKDDQARVKARTRRLRPNTIHDHVCGAGGAAPSLTCEPLSCTGFSAARSRSPPPPRATPPSQGRRRGQGRRRSLTTNTPSTPTLTPSRLRREIRPAGGRPPDAPAYRGAGAWRRSSRRS